MHLRMWLSVTILEHSFWGQKVPVQLFRCLWQKEYIMNWPENFLCLHIFLFSYSSLNIFPLIFQKKIFVPYSPSLGNWCFRNVYSWWCNFVIIFDCIIIKVKTIWRYFHNKSSSFCIFYMHLKLRQVNFDYFLACQIFKIILLYKIISEALHLKLWI